MIDLESIRSKVKALADCGPEEIIQEDIFFNVPHGRLKLRIFADSTANLISYHRPDRPGPKLSDYKIFETARPKELKDILASTLGIKGIVKKVRQLYIKGRTRIHLDRVELLGDFMELEVVLDESEPFSQGRAEAEKLMANLAIDQSQLIDKAYIDLLEI